VRLLRASILQWLHQFDAARADLDALIAADGADVMQAHLIRATVMLVQGDPASARHDCVALINHVETLIAATCIASVNSRLGPLGTVRQALEAAVAQTPQASLVAKRWALTELADMEIRLRQPDRAEKYFLDALALSQQEGARDTYLLAAYADFLLDAHRPQQVITLLQGLDRIDNLFLRQALAEQQLAATDPSFGALANRDTIELARRFAETRERGDGVHQREEAMLQLSLQHDPQRALETATVNWQRQRELIDARLLLDCASAAGRPAAADTVRQWAKRTGLQDARL
jgi:tetratricopeptide (TPR) repeat protein